MTKKQLYIIIGVITIITIGFLVAAYIISKGDTSTKKAPSTSPISNFFPFGKPADTTSTKEGNKTVGTNNQNGDTNFPNSTNSANLPIFRQISKGPIAGYYSLTKSFKSYIDYIDKETGNIHETKLEDMETNRVSNAVIPRISEALFGNKGNSVVIRYLKNNSDIVSSYVLKVPTSRVATSESDTATNDTVSNGKFLPQGILDLIVARDEKSAFYLSKTSSFDTQSSIGTVFDFEKNTASDVFKSPFTEWLPVYFDGKTVLLQTKSSQKVAGYLYSFNIKTGVLQKLLGGINGLTTLPSPDSSRILYSESTGSSMSLSIYQVNNNTVIRLPIQTLPEKCVWTGNGAYLYCAVPSAIPSGEYPDLWYQGLVSFSDTIHEIDTKTGRDSTILVPSVFTNESFDMQDLKLSPLEDYLFLINKRNSSLWTLDLTQVEGD